MSPCRLVVAVVVVTVVVVVVVVVVVAYLPASSRLSLALALRRPGKEKIHLLLQSLQGPSAWKSTREELGERK